jgi:hypothetical protein
MKRLIEEIERNTLAIEALAKFCGIRFLPSVPIGEVFVDPKSNKILTEDCLMFTAQVGASAEAVHAGLRRAEIYFLKSAEVVGVRDPGWRSYAVQAGDLNQTFYMHVASL